MDKQKQNSVGYHAAEKTEGYDPQDRRADDRRKTQSEGYHYVSVVGWIDRREYGRRTKDQLFFY